MSSPSSPIIIIGDHGSSLCHHHHHQLRGDHRIDYVITIITNCEATIERLCHHHHHQSSSPIITITNHKHYQSSARMPAMCVVATIAMMPAMCVVVMITTMPAVCVVVMITMMSTSSDWLFRCCPSTLQPPLTLFSKKLSLSPSSRYHRRWR